MFARVVTDFGVNFFIGLLIRSARSMRAKLNAKPEASGGASGGANPKTKAEVEADNKAKADAAAKPKPKSRTELIDERIKTDPKVARDIKKDDSAVYGYSPKDPKEGARLGGLHNVDYTDAKQVAKAREVRSHYKVENGNLDSEIAARKKTIIDNGGDFDSPEMKKLAEDAVNGRNRIRSESNKLTGTLDRMHERNLKIYGRKEGPTLKQLIDDDKTIEGILKSSTKSNKGADIVVGLWP